MSPTQNDAANELQTRDLSTCIHKLIDKHREQHNLPLFEWDLSLYYLALSLSKAFWKHYKHPNTHPHPKKKCIGIAYKFSVAVSHSTLDITARLFRRLNHHNWNLDGYIFSTVAAYQKSGSTVVINVVSCGAVIPKRVCPLCRDGCHFSASSAAAVFGGIHSDENTSASSEIDGATSSTTVSALGSELSTGSAISGMTASGSSAVSVLPASLHSAYSGSPSGSASGQNCLPEYSAWAQYAGWAQTPHHSTYPHPWWYGYTYPG